MDGRVSLSEEFAQMQAPFIFKMKFYQPSPKNQSRNSAHIVYIGTRPGVELGSEQLGDDGQQEIDFGIDPGTAQGHVKYAHERPGSHGLFSSSTENVNMLDVQKDLEGHEGLVWRGVLSLREDDATRLDLLTKTKWEDVVRSTMAEAAAKMGIGETNLRWVAAFHQEQGHPHVHFVLWEKDPIRRKGTLSKGEREDMKAVFMNEVYGEERVRLLQEKTAMRDFIRDISRDEMVDTVNIVREMRTLMKEVELDLDGAGASKTGIAPKLHKDDMSEIAKRLQTISEMLPGKGRIAFQFMPEDVKEAVVDTSKWLLKQPAFLESVNTYQIAVEGMTKQHTIQPERIQAAKDKAMDDLTKRVSQIVLKASAEAKRDPGIPVNPERAKIVVERISMANGKIDEYLPQVIIKESAIALKDLGLSNLDQLSVFHDWSIKASLGLSQDELKAIVDDVSSHALNPLTNEKTELAVTVMKLSGMNDSAITEACKDGGKDIGPMLLLGQRISQDADQALIPEKDWKQFARHMGIPDAPYPWKAHEELVITSQERDRIPEIFRNSLLSEIGREGDPGYIAFCMTVALKQMGISADVRASIMGEWANRNQVSEIGRILTKIESAETNYLRKSTWDRITQSLDLKIPYPWVSHEVLRLDKDLYDEARNGFATSKTMITEAKGLKAIGEQYAAFLRAGTKDIEHISHEVNRWLERSDVQHLVDVRYIISIQKRDEDILHLAKHLGIKDAQAGMVRDMATVLFAAGLDQQQVTETIQAWKGRSGSPIDEKQIHSIVQSAFTHTKELKTWGRDPIMSKKDFRQLTRNLDIKAPYMWGHSSQGRDRSRTFETPSNMNLAKSLWKGVWKGIEKERMQSEASAESRKRQMLRQLEREKERQREQGD